MSYHRSAVIEAITAAIKAAPEKEQIALANAIKGYVTSFASVSKFGMTIGKVYITEQTVRIRDCSCSDDWIKPLDDNSI